MRFKVNKKGNKALEESVDKTMREGEYNSKTLRDFELFAYGYTGKPTRDETAFYVNRKENTIIHCRNGLLFELVKIEVEEGVDLITAYVNHIRGLTYGLSKPYVYSNLTLASWVYKYLLENYDAKCQLQLDNIAQQGDPESLFAGPDACKNLETLFEGLDEE